MKYNIPELPETYKVTPAPEDAELYPLYVTRNPKPSTEGYCALVVFDGTAAMCAEGYVISWSHKFDSVQDAINVVCQRLMLGEFT